MKKKRSLVKSLSIRSVFAFLAIIGILVGVQYYFFQKEVRYGSKLYGKLALTNGALQIQDFLDKEYVFIEELANNLSFRIKENDGTNLSREEINKYIKEIFNKRHDLFGVGVIFEPNAFDGKDEAFKNKSFYGESGRYMYYVNRLQPEMETLEAGIEFADFYSVPKTTGKPIITNPYKYPIQGVSHTMIVISFPIIVNGKFCGIVASDIYLDTMDEQIRNIEIYDGQGTLALLDNEGNYVTHNQNEDLVGKNLSEDTPNAEQHLRALQNGKEEHWIEGDKTCISVPVRFNEHQLPWQLQSKINTNYVNRNLIHAIEWIIPILILSICCFILLIRFIVKKDLKPLEKLSEISTSIASGNLRHDFNIHSNNEIGVLSDSFKRMVEQLSLFIGEIQEGSEFISSASNQLNSNSQALSDQTNSQAIAGDEITSSMDEMSTSIQQNAERCQAIYQCSKEVVEQMNELNAEVNKASSMQSDISELVDAVNSVASNIKILALNAAVEAARAGSYGKGFAVVAYEVQKLSASTEEISKQITDKIQKSQEYTANATHMSDKIVPSLQNLNVDIRGIQDTSNEQAENVQQVTRATQVFNDNNQYNAASAEELAGTADEMSHQSERLMQKASQFNIS